MHASWLSADVRAYYYACRRSAVVVGNRSMQDTIDVYYYHYHYHYYYLCNLCTRGALLLLRLLLYQDNYFYYKFTLLISTLFFFVYLFFCELSSLSVTDALHRRIIISMHIVVVIIGI